MDFLSEDPYGNIAWRSELRKYAEMYLEADDALKQGSLELKPYRQRKKEAKEKIEQIMTQNRVDVIPFEERSESIILQERKTKKKPDTQRLLERCQTIHKNNEAEARKLYEFLFKPVQETVTSLRRKKLTIRDVAEAVQADDDE